jgi:hypothetical protein
VTPWQKGPITSAFLFTLIYAFEDLASFIISAVIYMHAHAPYRIS